jgi:hypothetical protein
LVQGNACAACHSLQPGTSVQITEAWSKSVHANRGVGCVGCHGGDPTQNEALAAMSPQAGFVGSLSGDNSRRACVLCHTQAEQSYFQGAHGRGEAGGAAPTCVTCHGSHDVPPASADLFLGTQERRCGSCHQPGSAAAIQVDAIYQALSKAERDLATAEAAVDRASKERLDVAEAQEALLQANALLTESRAAQHGMVLAGIEQKSRSSMELSRRAQASAEDALRGTVARQTRIVVVVGAVLLASVSLALIGWGLRRRFVARRGR